MWVGGEGTEAVGFGGWKSQGKEKKIRNADKGRNGQHELQMDIRCAVGGKEKIVKNKTLGKGGREGKKKDAQIAGGGNGKSRTIYLLGRGS